MANIFILTLDVFHILDIEDKIALACNCELFRQLCVRGGLFRKMDLSRRGISTAQRCVINNFFRDRQLTKHVTELNVSNLRVLNWQMDDQLEKFISICPHLEALHVLNCGLSLQRLLSILNQAPNLRALSWSLWDFTFEDIEFLLKSMKSSKGICFRNIKYLHLEIPRSLPHIQTAKYLVLSCCKDLEQLYIYLWWLGEVYSTEWNFPLSADELIAGFPQPPVENQLQQLHSLLVVAVKGPLSASKAAASAVAAYDDNDEYYDATYDDDDYDAAYDDDDYNVAYDYDADYDDYDAAYDDYDYAAAYDDDDYNAAYDDNYDYHAAYDYDDDYNAAYDDDYDYDAAYDDDYAAAYDDVYASAYDDGGDYAAAYAAAAAADDDDVNYEEELSDFVISVMRRKSSSTKWKKLWISPSIAISTRHLTDLSHLLHSDVFQSVEVISANPGFSANSMDELETFFERIDDNTVRSLHLCLPDCTNSIGQFCEPISRVGGHSLKFLCLSVRSSRRIPDEQNVFIHTLFSNCMNITELDLLHCSFKEDIVKPLSELKHLTKVQLMQCAISSKHSKKTQVEILKANVLTFVENCKNITHLDVRGCIDLHKHFSCRLTDGDLLAFAELRNLKSLTLYDISCITEWTFLRYISEHCKFLTMLRITDRKHFKNSHIPLLMKSVRSLKHLAIHMDVPVLGSEVFWNLLSHAKNLQRLCIKSIDGQSLNVPFAVETLKYLPRLHVLHLHSYNKTENVDDFYEQIIRILEEKESNCRFSFEFVTGSRRNTWINHQTGYSLISNKALLLNKAELCDMIPILDIPRS